jgi:hypothetical protein
MNNPTPEQFIHHSISQYPTLYASKRGYAVAELHILDQLLNVIGNGVRDNQELREHLSEVEEVELDQRYFTDDLYYGYFEVKKFGEGEDAFYFPEGEPISCVEEDKVKHPDVVHWTLCRGYGEEKPFLYNPYPNFRKEYSVIYQCPEFLELGDEWLKAAIKFYEYCQQFFVDYAPHYHSAFPTHSAGGDERRLADFAEMIGREDKYETFDDITKGYNYRTPEDKWIPYEGDNHEFLTLKWQRQLEGINEFLTETIKLLNSKLEK